MGRLEKLRTLAAGQVIIPPVVFSWNQVETRGFRVRAARIAVTTRVASARGSVSRAQSYLETKHKVAGDALLFMCGELDAGRIVFKDIGRGVISVAKQDITFNINNPEGARSLYGPLFPPALTLLCQQGRTMSATAVNAKVARKRPKRRRPRQQRRW